MISFSRGVFVREVSSKCADSDWLYSSQNTNNPSRPYGLAKAALPVDVLSCILDKAALTLKDLIRVMTVSKAFYEAAKGVKEVEFFFKCFNCAEPERPCFQGSVTRILREAKSVKALRMESRERTCHECVDSIEESASHKFQDWEEMVASWIGILKEDLEDFVYWEEFYSRFEHPRFGSLLFGAISHCRLLKRIELRTAVPENIMDQLSSSWLPHGLLELSFSGFEEGHQKLMNTLTKACPFLRKLSFLGLWKGDLSIELNFLESLKVAYVYMYHGVPMNLNIKSAPNLRDLAIEYQGSIGEVDGAKILIHKQPLAVKTLSVKSVSWKQTSVLLSSCPDVQDLTIEHPRENGVFFPNARTRLATVLGQVTQTNREVKKLRLAKVSDPSNDSIDKHGLGLARLSEVTFVRSEKVDFLNIRECLESFLPKCPSLKLVKFAGHGLRDYGSDSEGEQEGKIETFMSDLNSLQASFPGVKFDF
ncbi:hypothetical protein KFL_000320500 [Klebsormidium nitens]|uniref:F-box domain-containing protein n=1 Tax=Klebsormidium nitens TaxID=105231 RepID=A0A1Y1HP44_KLENI|nr:hypothetical protein KFL_000320500 [Klebsormidium nitens]|eukprot:GAQ79552.1 hypothetical protein KFL_000320500 [Klebsormidium nitens]